jgi:hypothetical protein
MEMSADMASKIIDRILLETKEWQSRPLNPVYPFVFMDCIHYKVREDGRILSRAACPGKAAALSELLLTCPGLQKRRTQK